MTHLKIYKTVILAFLFMIFLLTLGCSGAQQTPAIITVVQTVPVEVTRLVEMTVPVEVTREVFQTQIVEVQVTTTPAVTSTPTIPAGSPQIQQPAGSQFTAGPVTTAGFTPQAKGEGFTPVFVSSYATDRLEMYLRGPIDLSVVLNPDNVKKIWLSRGNYTYTVYDPGGLAYDGDLRIASNDKYEIYLYNNKAVIAVP